MATTTNSESLNTEAEVLLDIEGAARRLNVTPRFMRRLVAEKRVPYLKVGKFIRFDPNDLSSWLSTRRVEIR